jgi:hypothetical protein
MAGIGRRKRRPSVRRGLVSVTCAAVAVVVLAGSTGPAAALAAAVAGHGPRVGPVVEVSRGCAGQNAESEQAVDSSYEYEVWIGCRASGSPVLSTAAGASALR